MLCLTVKVIWKKALCLVSFTHEFFFCGHSFLSLFNQLRGLNFSWPMSYSGAFWQTPKLWCSFLLGNGFWTIYQNGHNGGLLLWQLSFTNRSPVSTKILFLLRFLALWWLVWPQLCSLTLFLQFDFFYLRIKGATVGTLNSAEMCPSPDLRLDTILPRTYAPNSK